MTKLEKILLVTNKGNIYRAEVELGLTGKIKAVSISDFKGEKEARYEPFTYANKVNDLLEQDLAHISQGLDGNPIFSSYEQNEKITEIYSLKKGK